MAETRTACPYCGVGCGVIVEHDDARIIGVRGDPDHPANFGRLCSKGSTLHLTATEAVLAEARALVPQARPDRASPLLRTSWNDALDLAALKIGDAVEAGGPDRVAFYISGQLLTEEYCVFNKLAKGLVGTNNVDTNSRLCMSSAVSGYKQTLGADAPPCCYDDLASAKTLFIAGSNTAFAHPILFRRIEDAKRADPGLRIVVVDPRRTETAEAADLHLAIAPGTDVPLFHGMLHVMLWEGWIDTGYIAAHTTGFDALRSRVRDFAPKDVAKVCGIAEADLVQAARWFANVDENGSSASSVRKPTLSLWCQGLNQSRAGTDKNAALIGMHLACGQIGKPGAGPFSLTGQPNAMGGREVGGMATLLGGHRDLADPEHRAEIASLWGLDEADALPAEPGLTAVELFQAAADGAIDVLWIACTNPAQSMPDQALVRKALARTPFVIVQDAFAGTATAAYADLLLPASTWGEKEGTMTNSERRISRVRAAVAPPGEARDDWRIVADVARRLEARLRPGRRSLFPYETPEQVWNEHRESTRGRDLDITGLSWASLEAAPAQWPCPAVDVAGASIGAAGDMGAAPIGKARLYEDGVFATPDGRARFAAAAYEKVAEARDARRPFALNTGRLRDQWHGMSRSGTVPRLYGHAPEPALEMNRADMERLFVADGDLVKVASKRGAIVLPARGSEALKSMQLFAPMHWGEEFLSGGVEAAAPVEPLSGPAGVDPSLGGRMTTGGSGGVAAPTRAALIASRLHGAEAKRGPTPYGVNALTTSAFCPTSKQPELKHAAVKVEPANLRWRLFAIAWFDDATLLRTRRALQALMPRFVYAACVPFGRERQGLLFRAASPADAAPDAATLDAIETLLGLDGSRPGRHLRFADARRAQRRSVRFEDAADRSDPGDDSADTDDGTADAPLAAVLLAGDARGEAWIKPWFEQRLPAATFGRALLAASATPPLALPVRGRQVCNCFNVSEDEIAVALAAIVPASSGATAALGGRSGGVDAAGAVAVAALQAELRCGTQCGSCLPELRQLARRRLAEVGSGAARPTDAPLEAMS